MENNENMKKKEKNIILSVLVGFCFIIIVLNLFKDIRFLKYINYASIIIICILMFKVFISVLKLNEFNDFTYFSLHFVYVFLPTIFIMQKFDREDKCEFIIYLSMAFIISLINCFIVYKYKKEITRNHLKYLIFWNAKYVTFIAVVIAIIKYFNIDMHIILYLLFIAPLLILQLVYKRIELEKDVTQ